MKIKNRIIAAGLITAALGLAGCNQGAISTSSASQTTTTSQTTSAGTTSALSSQAQNLGKQVREAGNQAVGIAQGFLSGLTNQEINAETFRSAWADLKAKLQVMYDNAASAEAKAKIAEAMTSLEAKFNTTLEQINANKSIQEIEAAAADFFKEAVSKIRDLTK